MILLTESARAAKREYEKKWRAANPDRVKAKNHRYWEKKATERKGEDNAENEVDREVLSESTD